MTTTKLRNAGAKTGSSLNLESRLFRLVKVPGHQKVKGKGPLKETADYDKALQSPRKIAIGGESRKIMPARNRKLKAFRRKEKEKKAAVETELHSL